MGPTILRWARSNRTAPAANRSRAVQPPQGRPLQTWKTFIDNHAEGIASIDLFVVPTIVSQLLFAFLVLGHQRRQLLWLW
jgi:hypothetical protein